MSLNQCFDPVFTTDDSPQDILDTIQNDRDTMYFIDSLNFDPINLNDFIAEENCSVVFYNGDGFGEAKRIKFIIDRPSSSIVENIIVMNVGISKEELQKYAGNGATIFVCSRTANPWHQFTLVAFAKGNPGKVEFTPTGYTVNQINFILGTPQIRMQVRKTDFSNNDINSFIAVAKERVRIEKMGFDETEIQGFRDKGGRIV